MTCLHRPNCGSCRLSKGLLTLSASADLAPVCKSWQHLRVLHRDLRLLNPNHRPSCHDLQTLQVFARLTDAFFNSRTPLTTGLIYFGEGASATFREATLRRPHVRHPEGNVLSISRFETEELRSQSLFPLSPLNFLADARHHHNHSSVRSCFRKGEKIPDEGSPKNIRWPLSCGMTRAVRLCRMRRKESENPYVR